MEGDDDIDDDDGQVDSSGNDALSHSSSSISNYLFYGDE